jgi:hypothetical protein
LEWSNIVMNAGEVAWDAAWGWEVLMNGFRFMSLLIFLPVVLLGLAVKLTGTCGDQSVTAVSSAKQTPDVLWSISVCVRIPT